jgi:hypothetical protein
VLSKCSVLEVRKSQILPLPPQSQVTALELPSARRPRLTWFFSELAFCGHQGAPRSDCALPSLLWPYILFTSDRVCLGLLMEREHVTRTLMRWLSPHCLGQNGSSAEWVRVGDGGGGWKELVRMREPALEGFWKGGGEQAGSRHKS